ncbi:MAG: OmpA family protein [Gammaproteobacteria bacterium]|nr:OmpA family protein [Gammaproteobacteria bacterium]MBU2004048.1 OmpA family protein [Gammaproteobacteria bacterium]
MSRIFGVLLLFILSVLLIMPAQATTKAGTRITNQAEASYFDTESGQVINVLSNYATLVVGRYLGHEQTQDNTLPAVGGQPVYFPHVITNTGNVADAYSLLVDNLPDDNGDLENLRIYLDDNGDGQVNPGEQEIIQTSVLQPGQQLQVVIVGTVPSAAAIGDQYAAKLTSTSSQNSDAQKSSIDTVSVDTGAMIRMSRFTDMDCSIGLTLGHKIYNEVSFTNLGNDIPAERTVVVDNIPLQGVLIEEKLSRYVSLASDRDFFAAPVQAMPLVFTQGGMWISRAQWDGVSKVEKVGILLPAAQMKPHQSGKFGYTLQVIGQPETQSIVYIQSTLDENADNNPEFNSNSSCNTLLPPKTEVIENVVGTVSGVVFDSASLDRIPDAEILLMDVATNTAVATTTSDNSGLYLFTNIAPGKYYLKVNPPASYVMPSVNPASNFPGRNVSDPSYGIFGFVAVGSTGSGTAGVFELTDAAGAAFDIPLDRIGVTSQISIEKAASKTTVAIGDLLSYTVKIRNVSGQELYATHIEDRLPYGFRYLSGTARLGDTLTQDPVVTPAAAPDGVSLSFRLGNFPADAELSLTYITQVTATATGSEGINTAHALANTLTGLQIHSPVARAQVQVKQEGVLSDRAILFGRIAVEPGCAIGDDKKRQETGWPLADVRLYMEDGTYVVTDPDGQFSLYGLKPGLHVLKVDPYTLPEGVLLKAMDTAHAGDPDSRFVDLVPGDFQRADFTASCPEAVTKTAEKCTEKEVSDPGREWTTRTIPNIIAPLHFDSGKAIILPEYMEKLRQMIKLAKDKQNVRFGFIGHTDNQRLKSETRKQFKDNQGLSVARAHEAAEYVLKNLGVQTDISVDGKGDTQPVASNDTPEGMAKNRRVEIVLIYDEPVEKHSQTTRRICSTQTVAVTACNRKRLGLQSARFSAHISCE